MINKRDKHTKRRIICFLAFGGVSMISCLLPVLRRRRRRRRVFIAYFFVRSCEQHKATRGISSMSLISVIHKTSFLFFLCLLSSRRSEFDRRRFLIKKNNENCRLIMWGAAEKRKTKKNTASIRSENFINHIFRRPHSAHTSINPSEVTLNTRDHFFLSLDSFFVFPAILI